MDIGCLSMQRMMLATKCHWTLWISCCKTVLLAVGTILICILLPPLRSLLCVMHKVPQLFNQPYPQYSPYSPIPSTWENETINLFCIEENIISIGISLQQQKKKPGKFKRGDNRSMNGTMRYYRTSNHVLMLNSLWCYHFFLSMECMMVAVSVIEPRWEATITVLYPYLYNEQNTLKIEIFDLYHDTPLNGLLV